MTGGLRAKINIDAMSVCQTCEAMSNDRVTTHAAGDMWSERRGSNRVSCGEKRISKEVSSCFFR